MSRRAWGGRGAWATWAACGGVGLACGDAGAIDLQNATATFSQTTSGNFFASAMIDNNTGPFDFGWAIWDPTAPGGVFTTTQAAAFETVTDMTYPSIRLHLHQNYHDGVHNVGRFGLLATSDHRSTFCNGLQTGGDVTAQWWTLIPGIVTLPPGMSYLVMPDLTLLLSGPNTGGMITVTYNLPPNGGITGFRLDVVEHASLPTDGPGRAPNGNFVITEMRIARFPCVADLTHGAIPSQPTYGVPDGALNNDDFFWYLAEFAAGNVARCDLTFSAIPASPGYGFPNGILNNDDFFYYLATFAAGC